MSTNSMWRYVAVLGDQSEATILHTMNVHWQQTVISQRYIIYTEHYINYKKA